MKKVLSHKVDGMEYEDLPQKKNTKNTLSRMKPVLVPIPRTKYPIFGKIQPVKRKTGIIKIYCSYLIEVIFA